ncbi:T9SS type A sorting domain-containing protein [Aequorivita vladivostokensis]|uniref:Secretion system C-terminal sorting domain-containing protein n=1 Tax=Aequorivita vladivostokensis TaxID=171194 RepID=A0ABR5DF51_9FLAO|nr:T9SS type A sorting domain-containing protein [Aequorivita vladivostokensis]KJJ37408.1 hypothetical protein MB09_14345 [Aequorivita vladivostokensis]
MKNLLLFSTLLLSTTGVFAQLTVKPTSGGADSYIYVNDEVVFVTQEINLTRNISGPANTEASIYLRNNGQLIQGGTTSTNSGDGQLSVQQNTPETNAWAYYYWCSPVTHPAVAAGNRNFGVQHLYEPLPAFGVTAAQPALTTTGRDGTIIPRMTISTRWLYTHMNPGTEAEGNYQRMNSNNAAPAGYGFTMKGVGLVTPGHDQTYEFRGRPNTGTIMIPVADQLMTLSGNPYPSALDLNQLFYDSGNEELGALWFYDEDRNVNSHYYSQKPYGYGVWTPETLDNDGNLSDNWPQGQYVAAPFYYYNAGGGHGGTQQGTGNTLNRKRYAPIGQGFMFVGNSNAGDGWINIRNNQRLFYKEGNPGSVFQRPIEENAVSEHSLNDGSTFSTSDGTVQPDYRTPIMRIWSIFDEAVTRDMVLAFYDQATDGYDRGLDGLSAQDLKTDAYFPIGEDSDRKPYVINGIKFDRNKQVPIAFKIKNQSKLDIKVVEEVKRPYTNAYIYDRVENTYQQINRGMSATFNLPTGTYDNRFFIVFRNPNVKGDISQTVLNGRQMVLDNVSFFQNNPQKQLEINNPEGYVIKSALVYDMNGKLVIQEKNLGDQTKYSFYTGNLSDGVYLVKLMTADDIAIDYKAIVHNK